MTTDEGFREIQLNGKQLVFLFMAATVVSVVIFLCGVLVGRGVRTEHPAAADPDASDIAPDRVAPPANQPAAAASAAPASVDPPAPADDFSYPDRLQKNATPAENLKSPSSMPVSSAAPPRAAPAPPKASNKVPAPAAASQPVAAVTTSGPSGPGFAVQVTTRPDRESADSLVSQLIKKGYPAFVAGPVSSGGRMIFRIRVGKYKTAKEAESVSKRLEAEQPFNFKPWIAR